MRYHYLRLDLHRQQVYPLLESTNAVPPTLSRQDYLAEIFGHRIDFRHRKQGLIYVPIGKDHSRHGLVMLGRVGKQIKAVENAPPEDQFAELSRESWRAANVLIDIEEHDDGQKIAFQKHYQVGTPAAIAESLVAHVNQANPHAPWSITVNRITDERSFWEAVEHYANEIIHAEFTLDTPNILGMGAALRAELESAREQHNATSITESLHNLQGGLKLEQDNLGDAVKYIAAGGGSARLRTPKGTVYSTTSKGRETQIKDDPPLRRDDRSGWAQLISKLFR